jgi:hypothetical protein
MGKLLALANVKTKPPVIKAMVSLLQAQGAAAVIHETDDLPIRAQSANYKINAVPDSSSLLRRCYGRTNVLHEHDLLINSMYSYR